MSNTITECAVDLASAVKREDKANRELITCLLNEVSTLKERLLAAENGIKNLDAQLLHFAATVPRKQAADATILVNQQQLTNMVFHELTAGLEGSGKICDVVQEFVSETVRTIMHDYVKDELEKMLPTCSAFQKEVDSMIRDHIVDHMNLKHGGKETLRIIKAAVASVASILNASYGREISAEKEKDGK